MKILSGIYQKDSGEILKTDNEGNLAKLEIKNPKFAQEIGISMVFQEFNLLDNISIAENIFIGREPRKKHIKTLDWQRLFSDAEKTLEKVKLSENVRTKVSNLSVAQKQTVEIAKCLSYNSKIIILDEPTASLTDKEAEVLFSLINDLKNKGVSFIYISHRMEEIFNLSDRITVFRDGKLGGTFQTNETTPEEIVKNMIGRKLDNQINSIEKRDIVDEIVLEVKNVNVGVTKRSKPLDFCLHKGEILGFFGLVGAGRTELAKILFGIDDIGTGEIYRNGKKIKIKKPEDAISQHIAMVPEDRKDLGLVLKLSVKENLVLSKLRYLNFFRWNMREENQITKDYIKKLSIALSGENQLVEELSGGNQQKVIISKWLATNPEILILDEPTRGIDIGAKTEIYNIMRNLTKQGMSIIMISSELPEIMRVSDRVIVMHEGIKTLDSNVNELNEERILQAAVGGI